MSVAGVPIFRAEAVRHRADRLHGNVGLATPVAWQAIGFLLLAALLIVIGFLTRASYSRVETAAGAITLDKGVATIMPSRTGTVASLAVSEGQRVHAGDRLAYVRSEEDMADGGTAPARIRDALGEQDESLASQGGMLLDAARAEQDRLRQQIIGLVSELASIEGQIDDQRRLVAVANAEYDRVDAVAAKGFISRRDMEDRQATIVSRRQQLAQLQQTRASKTAAIAEARSAISQSGATARAQIASARSDRAGLAQQLAQADLARGYAIRSPVDGIVTALTARLGQSASNQQQLMMIVPDKSQAQVEIYVPTSAAGFLHRGQQVRLAVDAFPYQTFGTVAAEIRDVSAVTIVRQAANGPVAVYLVTARLPKPWIMAYGQRQILAPGMTLAARIVTERRSLLEWLFQPVFAVGRR
jgi:membrane fusion protein